jgi:hypothetical protein
VLRDFDDRAGNFDRIKKILEGDIDKIWSEIYKSEKHENSKCTDFFHFEYSMLPHKIFQEDNFYKKAAELKLRFTVGAEDSLYLPDSEEKNVPMDGLTFFIEQAWDTIRHQKELNLPDQRAMVASYRCNELKEEAVALILE